MISDVIMPELGGRDLVDALHTRWPTLPVLYISGYTNQEIIDTDGQVHGNARFLAKPFTSKELSAAVRDALQTTRDVPTAHA